MRLGKHEYTERKDAGEILLKAAARGNTRIRSSVTIVVLRLSRWSARTSPPIRIFC
ncbi:MAG: hypothetical protein LBU32_07785 [Clostridiales bacterium]|nr:hypothetical protein [Clostridiales bacterium]